MKRSKLGYAALLAALLAGGSSAASAAQANFAYDGTNNNQNFYVPATGYYRIFANGAAGGSTYDYFSPNSYRQGGAGASIGGIFHLFLNDNIQIALGQRGGEGALPGSAGGGGGRTVVSTAANANRADPLLLIAGGGGGASGAVPGLPGEIGRDGSTATVFGGNQGVAGDGGFAGLHYTTEGIYSFTKSYRALAGGGGSGWLGNGRDGGPGGGKGGQAQLGGMGGTHPPDEPDYTPNNGANGGFGGGGGAGWGGFGGGGGGGYSGGAGGDSFPHSAGPGGGGGSYSSALAPLDGGAAGNSGHGSVDIFWADPANNGSSAATPLLPDSVIAGGYQFNFGAEAGDRIFVDPVLTAGYDYRLGAGSAFITSALFPVLAGDANGYDIFRLSDLAHPLLRGVRGGQIVDFTALGFAGGIDGFALRGIDRSAMLDPANPLGFVTGLTFGASGVVDLTQAPVTVGGVPEPASWAMLIAGFGLVGATQRRRRQKLVAA